MKKMVFIACIALAACSHDPGGPSVADIEYECHAGGRPFVDTWGCVRVGMGSVEVPDDLRAVYIATGDFIAEQITAEKMTDAEGKLAMAQARQRAHEATSARIQQQDAARNARAAVAIGMMRTSPSVSGGTQPTIIGTPQGGVVCQRTGPSSVYCG